MEPLAFRQNLNTPGLPRAAYDEHQRTGYAWSDTYNARKVFDDVLGGDDKPASVDLIDAARETVRTLKKRRLRTPPASLKLVSNDSTAHTFEPVEVAVIGADAGIAKGIASFFDKLRDRFKAAIGKPKVVRLDTDESYKDFRDTRRQPYVEALASRLALVEQAFLEHAGDGHGADFGFNDVEAFERHLDGNLNSHRGNDISLDGNYYTIVNNLIANAQRGGSRVNLGMPYGKVECWRDGDEVLVSARFSNGIATTGVVVDECFEEVVGVAEIVGCCGEDALIIGAHLAPAVCGLRLLGDLCRAAPTLSQASGPLIGALVPQADPGFAAMMGLLQRCQQGDKQALREAHKLAGYDYGLVCRAGERLTEVQRKKAQLIGMSAKEFGTNFYGGAHTGGTIILKAFGAGAVVDMLDPITKPALPGWAGGTADAKVPPPPEPPPPPPKAAQTISIVSKPDAVMLVYKSGMNDIIQAPLSVGVNGGTHFKGNGYNKGDRDKFSFGFEAPLSVSVMRKKGEKKKINATDVKTVAFQGGKLSAPEVVS